MRLEERVAERTRIARDLHDTLLQSFQGLLLRLQIVSEMLTNATGRGQEDPYERDRSDCTGHQRGTKCRAGVAYLDGRAQ